VHPAECVVLLPYAQLIQQARQAWAAQAGDTFFVPRFETTMNWAGGLGGTLGLFTPSGDDLRMDVAVDMLTAASLLGRAGLGGQQDALAGRLVEAAWSLAGVAAAVMPARRRAWSEAAGADPGRGPGFAGAGARSRRGPHRAGLGRGLGLPDGPPVPGQALAVRRARRLSGRPADRGAQGAFRRPVAVHPLCIAFEASPPPALHAAQDAEDEAGRAAACVLAHLAQGRSPVALIAQDRQLTRRVGAMLAERGIAMRDETGWKLSTTRAAAGLMSLLRALPWDASTDAVLDWLKNAPAFEPMLVTAAETELRRVGVRAWRDLPAFAAEDIVPPAFLATQPLALQANALRTPLARARPLAMWLRDLRAALQSAGQWDALAQDEAGQAVLEVLRLYEGAEAEFEASPVMRLNDFTQWANQALEGGKFSPPHPPAEQVVILPLAQLLGRPMRAVVLPGCDEIRLPVSPEPAGPWTPGQRELLGLPSRETLAAAARQAWRYALQAPRVDVLWRTSESGEHLIPSGFVQELLLARDDAESRRDGARRRPAQPARRGHPAHAAPLSNRRGLARHPALGQRL
jgi:ATP-dependent helicase/nuclease subunit B